MLAKCSWEGSALADVECAGASPRVEFRHMPKSQKTKDLRHDGGRRREEILRAQYEDLLARKVRKPPLQLSGIAASAEVREMPVRMASVRFIGEKPFFLVRKAEGFALESRLTDSCSQERPF